MSILYLLVGAYLVARKYWIKQSYLPYEKWTNEDTFLSTVILFGWGVVLFIAYLSPSRLCKCKCRSSRQC